MDMDRALEPGHDGRVTCADPGPLPLVELVESRIDRKHDLTGPAQAQPRVPLAVLVERRHKFPVAEAKIPQDGRDRERCEIEGSVRVELKS